MRLDTLISPLLMKGQSIHHICVNHADEIMLNERSLYNYVDSAILTAKNIDLPRVVRMGRQKKKKDHFKVDKKSGVCQHFCVNPKSPSGTNPNNP